MELKTNDAFSKPSLITSPPQDLIKTKKVITKKQPNKLDTKNKSDNSENLDNKKNKPDVIRNRFPSSANSISQRKDNPVITTIGMDKYKDILSRFDPNLRINNTNKGNSQTGTTISKDLGGSNIGIQQRMKAYLDTAKESTKLKTCTVDPLLGQLRGESSENNEADFSEKVDDDDDNNIEESHDDLKISMEEHHDEIDHKDNENTSIDVNNKEKELICNQSDKTNKNLNIVNEIENKHEEIKESH